MKSLLSHIQSSLASSRHKRKESSGRRRGSVTIHTAGSCGPIGVGWAYSVYQGDKRLRRKCGLVPDDVAGRKPSGSLGQAYAMIKASRWCRQRGCTAVLGYARSEHLVQNAMGKREPQTARLESFYEEIQSYRDTIIWEVCSKDDERYIAVKEGARKVAGG